MFVCLCHAVTDTAIENAVEEGAVTMQELKKELNVATQCGQCCSCAKKILTSKLMQISEASPVAA
jgi:bacterioferritin-associated ferredoxin